MREGKARTVTPKGKLAEERVPLKEVQQVQMSSEGAHVTNLVVYRSREVGICEKENLHPGELLTGVKCDVNMVMETSKNDEKLEDISACHGMAYGKEYATLELANDR